jgi:preprotein translocase subunit YajC
MIDIFLISIIVILYFSLRESKTQEKAWQRMYLKEKKKNELNRRKRIN